MQNNTPMFIKMLGKFMASHDFSDYISELQEESCDEKFKSFINALEKLKNIAIAAGADLKQVGLTAGKVEDVCISVYTEVGDALYRKGFFDALELLKPPQEISVLQVTNEINSQLQAQKEEFNATVRMIGKQAAI